MTTICWYRPTSVRISTHLNNTALRKGLAPLWRMRCITYIVKHSHKRRLLCRNETKKGHNCISVQKVKQKVSGFSVVSKPASKEGSKSWC